MKFRELRLAGFAHLPRLPRLPRVMAGPETYLRLFADALLFAFSCSSPVLHPPAFSNEPPKRGSWLWMSQQIMENAAGPPWATATNWARPMPRRCDELGDILPPFFASPTMSADIFELRCISRSRMATLNKWYFPSPERCQVRARAVTLSQIWRRVSTNFGQLWSVVPTALDVALCVRKGVAPIRLNAMFPDDEDPLSLG